MNPSESRVRQVVDEVRPFLEPDGGNVELLAIDGGVVGLRYKKGDNPRCVDCVMPPDDFRDYMLAMFKERVPGVTDVNVVPG